MANTGRGFVLDYLIENAPRLEMNFTASIYRREDRNWGSLMPDGSINGMISSLVKGEADLLATSLTMKPYRHSGCDFLVCLSSSGIYTQYGLYGTAYMGH